MIKILHLVGRAAGVQEEPGQDVHVCWGTLRKEEEIYMLSGGDVSVAPRFTADEVTGLRPAGKFFIIVLNRGINPEWAERRKKDAHHDPHPE